MNELQMTLTKTKTYSLKPFGRFLIKWNVSEKGKQNPKILDILTMRIDHSTGMPYTPEVEKEFVKYMVKNHTDILTDGYNFYTRINDNWVEVSHPKLRRYYDFLKAQELEDCKETWDKYNI